jgi:tetratricopeptide (TPR) repeat protein
MSTARRCARMGFCARRGFVVLWICLAGCVRPAADASRPVPAENIAALQAAVLAAPDDAELRIALASAYRAAGRPADAVAAVQPVVAADPTNAAALVQVGLAEEERGRIGEAGRWYRQYLALGASARVDRQVRGRLVLLERRELEEAVRSAVAQEVALRDRDPEPATVGVFPFLTSTTDPGLAPLGRALAELLTTDLAVTGRLRVLERLRLQLLLDEIALAESGRVDPATAARAGQMLGAGRIVQGRADGDAAELRIQAAAVAVRAAAGIDPLQEQGALAALFDMQKRIALGLHTAMGVQLTAAERERLLQRPTSNIQALLAFGFGLGSMDARQWREAASHFERAVQLDAAFAVAAEQRERAEAAAEAEAGNTRELERLAWLELGPGRWLSARERFAEIERMVPGPVERDPVSEVFGVERLDRRAIIDLIIRRPGGS